MLLAAVNEAAAEVVEVRVFNFDFSAAPAGDPILDPVINLGDTVRWVWESGLHDTTSVSGYSESWASPTTSQVGFTFDHTFTNVGVFPYYCSVHGFDNGDGTAGGMSGTITVVEPQSFFFGLPHEALGQAQLSSDPVGNLVVSNIGSSGQDGVSIGLGEARGPMTSALFFEDATLNAMPSTVYEFRSIGQVSGIPDQLIGTLTAVNNPGQIQMLADFTPIGVQSYRIKIYNGPQLVYETESIFPGPRFTISFTIEIDIDFDLGCLLNGCPPDNWDPTWPFAAPIDLQDGSGTHMGDRVLISGEDPTNPPDYVSRVEVRAADAGPFKLIDEALAVQGFPLNRALGEAHMQGSTGGLTISNIGSSGQDGVSIDLGQAERAGTRWAPQPLADTPDGAYYEVSAVGSFGGQQGQNLGSTRATKNGPGYQVTADYSPIGSSTQLLEIYNGEQLVVSLPGQSGLLAQFSQPPSGCDKNPPFTWWPPWPPFPPCFIWHLPTLGPIQIPGVGVFDGTELRVLAEGASAPIDFLEEFQIRMALIPPQEFTLEKLQARETFAGLTHVALGQAELMNDGGGTLVVSNIGSSGEDGVAIDLGEAEGFITGVPLKPAMMPAGSSMRSIFSGMVDGVPHQPAGTIGLLRSPDGVRAIVDYSDFGSPTYSVEIFSGDALLFSGSGFSGPEFEIQAIEDVDLECKCDWWGLSWEWTLTIELSIAGGGTSVIGDRIRFTPDLPVLPTVVATEVAMVAEGMPMFMIHDEALLMFELPNRALGTAQMEAGGDHLTISNIGSSGCDGVSIDLGDNLGSSGQDGVSLELAPVPDATWGPNGVLMLAATGVFSGNPETPLGSAGLRKNSSGGDSFFDVFTELSAIGSTDVRIEVYDGGSLVGSVIVPDGEVGSLSPSGTGLPLVTGCGKLPPDPPCFILEFDRLGIFTPISGPPLLGDELRLLADNASGTIDALSSFGLTGTNLDALTIVGEEIVLVCPGDLDGDGDVDLTDLAQLLSNYGTTSGARYADGDIDGDGDVDLTDLAALLSVYGTTCP